MAITYSDIQNRINLDYLNRTDFTNETKRAVIRAIKHYERARLWFNQTATAINASTAAFSIALPADFIALDMVTLTVNAGPPQIVTQRAYERVTYLNQGGLSGTPAECAVWNNALYMWPKPSSAFPITVNYTFRLAELSAGTDTNAWLTEAEDLICYHAAADVLANVIRGRDADVVTMQALEMAALKSLQLARNVHMNTGEDLALIGPQQRQDPIKTDGSPNPMSAAQTPPTAG